MEFTIKRIFGPKAYPIIGNAHLIIGDTADKLASYIFYIEVFYPIFIHNFFVALFNQILNLDKNYKLLWRVWLGTKLFVIIDNPEYIKTVLNNPNITDKSEKYEKFKPFAGNGLLTASGEFIIILLFLLEYGMLGMKINSLTNPDYKLVESIECKINRELTEKNSEPKSRTLLDFLFEISHERGKYSEQDISEQINTMAIAGSETAATTISFVFLMLATFPEIQIRIYNISLIICHYVSNDKVYEELNQIYCSDDPKRVPTYNNIKSMKLLEHVIKETLRLFSAVPVIVRRVTLDIEDISAYKMTCWTIPKGSSAVFLIYKLHRSAKYWPWPLVLDPDRFLSGKNCSTYLFLFSYGRRNCIGQNFAMLNMTIIIATLIRRFLIKINNPIGIAEIGLKMSVTLKPVKPIRVKFERIFYLFTRLFPNDPTKEPLENKE
ncbi:cytochrome P450 4C1-like [Vespa velutina]|uniref:cytochrome P450 4C1-like n=1 Tax=Vespa velutina TaxID=202808 RepID=UPI001FB531DD|nr:cytochrome P450 4C1-like [Vespa velutina]